MSIPDPPYQTIDNTSADDFRKQVDLNLIGYYLFAKVGMVTKVDVSTLLAHNVESTLNRHCVTAWIPGLTLP